MIKKIISAVSALSMLAAFAVAPVNAADTDANIYSYSSDELLEKATADGAVADDILKSYGLSINTTESYGFNASNNHNMTAGNESGIYWLTALRSGHAESVARRLLIVNLDTQNPETFVDLGDDIVALVLDFGIAMQKAQPGETYLNFNGKTADGTAVPITALKVVSASNSNDSKVSFIRRSVPADQTPSGLTTVGEEVNFKTSTDSSNNICDRVKIVVMFDMKTQTYSAYYTKLAEAGASSAISDPETIQMVYEAPFITDGVVAPTSMDVLNYKGYSGSSFCPVTMEMNILSDSSIMSNAAQYFNISGDVRENLPSRYMGAEITYSGSDLVASDGTITRPSSGEGDKTVNVKATLSKNGQTAEKELTFTIKENNAPANGVWVDDNMDYASVDEIPAIANNAYGFEFEQDGGEVSTGDGTITLVRETNTGNLGMYKYLAPSTEQQHNGKQIVEYKITKIGEPVVYTAVQSYNDWKGIQTLQINTYQDFSPFTGSGSIAAPESMTVTMVTDAASQIMDVYVNGKLQWNDIAYRSDWSNSAGFDYFGKIYMSVSDDSPVGSGIKVDYIRTFEDIDSYGEYCLEKAGASIDIPSEIAAGVDEISLPAADNYNNTIAWSSDNAAISTDGTVTHGIADVTVQLTPTYTNNVTGASKEGAPITVTVKAKDKTTTVGDPLEAINPDIAEGETQYAVGFMNTFISKNTGYAPEVGFILSYQDKTDMTVTISDNVEASEVKAGVILTYDEEDGFVLDDLKVRPYITE